MKERASVISLERTVRRYRHGRYYALVLFGTGVLSLPLSAMTLPPPGNIVNVSLSPQPVPTSDTLSRLLLAYSFASMVAAWIMHVYCGRQEWKAEMARRDLFTGK